MTTNPESLLAVTQEDEELVCAIFRAFAECRNYTALDLKFPDLLQLAARHRATRPAPPAQPGAGATQPISPEYNLLPKDITIAAEPLLARQDVRPEAEEQVERVAKAIYDATHAGLSNCYAWDDAWEDHQEARRGHYYKEARAAIATLPTEPASVREERLRIAAWLHSESVKYRSTRHISEADTLYYAATTLSTEEPKL